MPSFHAALPRSIRATAILEPDNTCTLKDFLTERKAATCVVSQVRSHSLAAQKEKISLKNN